MFEFLRIKRKPKCIHIIGIGGIGVSRLARWYLASGAAVSGSDLAASPITEALTQLGADIKLGHSAENIPKKCNLVIYTVAIPESSAERMEASKRRIRQMSHFEAIAMIASGKKVIAVAGTNGKSTTTAMLGLIAERAGLDPTVLVGSNVREWNGNVRIGKGKLFIVEADELNRQFLALSPFGVILTNIEADHMDYYKDLADIRSAFMKLAGKVPRGGFIIYNRDDELCREIAESFPGREIAGFGRSGRAVNFLGLDVGSGKQHVEIALHGVKEGFDLHIPSKFNVYNAMAAIGAAHQLKINFSATRASLDEFRGIWRRFEIVGRIGNATVVSDYGHHPTALLQTMEGVRSFYPGARVMLVFQPHQRRRTASLFDEFVRSLSAASPDKLVLLEIYDVAGRDSKSQISSRDLLEAVSRKLTAVSYSPSLERAEETIRAEARNFDLIICMGAGDIYRLAERLIAGDQDNA